ncbi:MAG: glyoxalase superfamily protein [Planktotalea sp.]|uniref:glyoxalase superfamily protein n=1 Tax=Planktotalea sp. TaxID=2029877 RepID=UPI003C795E0A
MTNSENGTAVPSADTLKSQAKRLRSAMAEKQTPITQSMALEAVARQWGYRDWNTLSAASKSNAPRGWYVGQRVFGSYLGHMFQGTLKAVRAAQGGYWYLTVVFDTAVDVIEFDSFSSFRKQVNVTLNEDGVTPGKTSNGLPHMELRAL